MDWGFGGFGGVGGGSGRHQLNRFESQYHVNSTGYAGKEVSEGDKIFLPPSALDKLARMNVDYPMLFEITNHALEKRTHCGVLEFSSDEGFCYMPYWMMENLGVSTLNYPIINFNSDTHTSITCILCAVVFYHTCS